MDEADSMTKDAQSALRRTMEKEGRSTRFCLVCNYISRIIEPITSRCAKFRFKPLSEDAIKKRIEMIATSENIKLRDDDAFDLLIRTSEGDMRKAITTLQSCSRLNTTVSRKDIFEVLLWKPFCFLIVCLDCSLLCRLVALSPMIGYTSLFSKLENPAHSIKSPILWKTSRLRVFLWHKSLVKYTTKLCVKRDWMTLRNPSYAKN